MQQTDEDPKLNPIVRAIMDSALNPRKPSWLDRKRKYQDGRVKKLSRAVVTAAYKAAGLKEEVIWTALPPWMVSRLAINETEKSYRVKSQAAITDKEHIDSEAYSEQYARRSEAKKTRNTLLGAWTSRIFAVLLAAGSFAGALNIVFFSFDWKTGLFFLLFALIALFAAAYPLQVVGQLRRQQIEVLTASLNIDLSHLCWGYETDKQQRLIARINDVRLFTPSGDGFKREVENHQLFGFFSGLLALPLVIVASVIIGESLVGKLGLVCVGTLGVILSVLVLYTLVTVAIKIEHMIIRARTELSYWLVLEHIRRVEKALELLPDDKFLLSLKAEKPPARS